MAIGDIQAARINADGWTVELDLAGFKIGGNKTRGRAASGTAGAYLGGAGDTVQYNLDPFGTPKLTLSCANRVGHDAAGAASSAIAVSVFGTVSRRKPYSAGGAEWTNDETDNTTYITIRIALDKQVFAGETLTLTALADIYLDNGTGGGSTSSNAVTSLAVTNNSTAVPMVPCLNWLTVPKQRIPASGITLELMASSAYGRNDRMLAAVVFTMTGATSGVVVNKTVTAMTLATSLTRTDIPKVCVFAGVFDSTDIAGFTQGETVNVSVTARPWVGAAIVSTAAYVAYPNVNMTATIPFVIDKAGTLRAYATVDPSGTLTTATTGCNTTGTENTTAGTCYADIDRAIKALYTYMARNEIAHGVVWLRAGTYASFGGTTSTTGTSPGVGWVEITRAPSTSSKADVTITTTAGQTVTNRKIGGCLLFRDLTLSTVASATGTDNIFHYGSDTTATPGKYVWIDNCDILGGNNTAASPSAFIHQTGMIYWTNNYTTQLKGTQFKSAAGRGHPLTAGSILGNCGQMQPYNVAGCVLSGGSYFQTPSTTSTVPQPTQMRFDFAKWSGTGNNTLAHYAGVGVTYTGGSSFVQSALDSYSGGSNPALQISADRDLTPFDHHVSAYSTITGQRNNFLYNSENAAAVNKRGVRRFCIYGGNQDAGPADDTYFQKRDTFLDTLGTPSGKQAGRIGNWVTSHGVDSLNNMRLERSFATALASPNSDIGDFDPSTVSINPSITSRTGFFVDDQSGTAHGGGSNLRLSAGTATKVPAGLGMLPYDQDGNPRRGDGTGSIGPYESAPEFTFDAAAVLPAFTAALDISVLVQVNVATAVALPAFTASADFGIGNNVTAIVGAQLPGFVPATNLSVSAAVLFGGAVMLPAFSAALTGTISIQQMLSSTRIAQPFQMKSPGSIVDWSISYSLDAGETISSSIWAVAPVETGGLVVEPGDDFTADSAACLVSGGVYRRVYELTNTIETTLGRTLTRTLGFRIGPVEG